MNGSKQKYVIYSGHETTLMGILPCLGYNLDDIPPYGSVLTFELYNDLSLHIYYNDELIGINYGKKPVSWKFFKQYVEFWQVEDIKTACYA